VLPDCRNRPPLARCNFNRCNDLRNDMAWRYKIDVVATLCLQLQHHVCELFRFDLAAQPLLTDVPVLAIHATKVAPAKENRAGTIPATQRIFFTVMRAHAVHDRTLARTAYGTFDRLQAVHAAVPGAEVAIFETPPGVCGAPCQLARFGEL
jgi:hypothetical protein